MRGSRLIILIEAWRQLQNQDGRLKGGRYKGKGTTAA